MCANQVWILATTCSTLVSFFSLVSTGIAYLSSTLTASTILTWTGSPQRVVPARVVVSLVVPDQWPDVGMVTSAGSSGTRPRSAVPGSTPDHDRNRHV